MKKYSCQSKKEVMASRIAKKVLRKTAPSKAQLSMDFEKKKQELEYYIEEKVSKRTTAEKIKSFDDWLKEEPDTSKFQENLDKLNKLDNNRNIIL